MDLIRLILGDCISAVLFDKGNTVLDGKDRDGIVTVIFTPDSNISAQFNGVTTD
jgi:hypothetical protein